VDGTDERLLDAACWFCESVLTHLTVSPVLNVVSDLTKELRLIWTVTVAVVAGTAGAAPTAMASTAMNGMKSFFMAPDPFSLGRLLKRRSGRKVALAYSVFTFRDS